MLSESALNELYRYAYSLAHDEDRAYDLLQHCLEKFLAKKIDVASPTSYIRTMIRNHYFDEFRREKLIVVVDDPVEDTAEEKKPFEDMLINEQDVEMLMNFLNPQERETLYLWVFQDYSLQEIANFQGIPKGTLTSKVHRLRQKIKHYLNEREKQQNQRGAL